MSADDEKPYRVGKGKPPPEHRWRKGQPSPNPHGRPPGSGKMTQLQKMLSKKVWATSSDGRAVRKTLHEIIDHKLVEIAAKGDLKAIKLIKELLVIYERLGLIDQPSPAQLRRQAAEEQEQREAAERIQSFILTTMDVVQELRRYDAVRLVDGRAQVSDWIIEAAAERQPNSGFAKRLKRRSQ